MEVEEVVVVALVVEEEEVGQVEVAEEAAEVEEVEVVLVAEEAAEEEVGQSMKVLESLRTSQKNFEKNNLWPTQHNKYHHPTHNQLRPQYYNSSNMPQNLVGKKSQKQHLHMNLRP